MTLLKYGTDFNTFRFFRDYSRIVVTGPQRGGTHFIAKIAAADLGYTYLDEDAIWSKKRAFRDWKKFVDLCKERDQWVLQATDLMIDIANAPSHILVLVAIRPIMDIVRSQKKISWEWEKKVFNEYCVKFPGISMQGPISEIRYRIWHTIQKHKIQCAWAEIDYNSFSTHPRWVPYKKRPPDRKKYGRGTVWNPDGRNTPLNSGIRNRSTTTKRRGRRR